MDERKEEEIEQYKVVLVVEVEQEQTQALLLMEKRSFEVVVITFPKDERRTSFPDKLYLVLIGQSHLTSIVKAKNDPCYPRMLQFLQVFVLSFGLF